MAVQEAHELGIEIFAADYPFDDHGKSILMEAKYGCVKVHWYHPTLSEIWSYPLEDIADELRS
jgi:hypothetical protein